MQNRPVFVCLSYLKAAIAIGGSPSVQNDRLSLDGEKCPSCGEGTLHTILRTEDFDFDLGDEGKVRVHAENVPLEKCDRCDELLSGPATAKIRDKARYDAAGLLLPPEIKAIRENLGWSQQYLANLTGFRIEHISLWERGRRLQNRSEDKVLRALRDNPPFREYLQGLLFAKSTPAQPALVSEQKAS